MDEPLPQDLHELAQQREEELDAEESLPQEVEDLLRVLQSGRPYLARQHAAEQLGNVGLTSLRVLRALTSACESDPYPEVRRAAAKSLRAPVHQAYLQQHPDLEQTEAAQSRALRPQEVEELLPVLQSGAHQLAREAAAELLGNVQTSSPRIVRALTVARESDPHPDVRRAAAGSLHAPVHREYLPQHPEAARPAEGALPQAAITKGTDRGGLDPQSRSLIPCLVASPIAGLAVGWVIGRWQAEQSLFHDGGLSFGMGFLVALAAGAVVGALAAAVVGGALQGRKEGIPGVILGAIVAGVVASLAWFPMQILQIVLMGGP